MWGILCLAANVDSSSIVPLALMLMGAESREVIGKAFDLLKESNALDGIEPLLEGTAGLIAQIPNVGELSLLGLDALLAVQNILCEVASLDSSSIVPLALMLVDESRDVVSDALDMFKESNVLEKVEPVFKGATEALAQIPHIEYIPQLGLDVFFAVQGILCTWATIDNPSIIPLALMLILESRYVIRTSLGILKEQNSPKKAKRAPFHRRVKGYSLR